MTLKVVVRTPQCAAEACRLVRAGGERELTPAGRTPASTGLFSLLPGTAWPGVGVANWGGHEVRCLIETPGEAVRLRSEAEWLASIYGIVGPVDLRAARPTWTYRDPRRRVRWSAGGADGDADAALLARARFSSAEPTVVLAVPDGIGCIIVRRLDEGPVTAPLSAETLIRGLVNPGGAEGGFR